MAKIYLDAVGRSDVTPREISPRLRSQLVYFCSTPAAAGVPELGEAEYAFAEGEVERWLDEGVFYLVSPLDTANMTEVEISEEQEDLLGWVKAHKVWHVRVRE